jgi:hypothetical protein
LIGRQDKSHTQAIDAPDGSETARPPGKLQLPGRIFVRIKAVQKIITPKPGRKDFRSSNEWKQVFRKISR